ncbi:MAG: cytochrome c oxidase accessory protein CcoG, partial [Verrucomicrobia bacterium]|nr:cytochrome c oxidase accessory protein CcoG [Verrucomicrobiota bacterium]
YGRFQSTLIDENSIVVAYDHKRGEQRAHLARGQTPQQRRANGQGDCIDCFECVTVCPTGIDIRNGTQMECVHCTACIDACDHVMTKIRRPKGLIRYASLDGIERGQPLKITPRLVGYTVLLLGLGLLLAALLLSRSDVETTLLRAQGALFQQMPNGRFSNLYTLRVLNKTSHPMPLELRLEQPAGSLQVLGRDLTVPAQQSAEASLLVELEASVLSGGSTPVIVGVYSGDRRLETLTTAFIGPRNDRR